MEKARESTDAANLRSAYAEVMAAGLTEDVDNYTKTVEACQAQSGWQSTNLEKIGDIAIGDGTDEINAVTKGSSWTVKFDATNEKVTISAN